MTSIDRPRGEPDPMGTAEVPKGWDPVAALCGAVALRLDDVATCCVADIHRSVVAYRGTAVGSRELHDSVVRNMEVLLLALAEHRPPNRAEIAFLRDLGGRRARQGMSISDVNEAFHIGYRHVWEQLVAEAASADDSTRSMLLGAATTMWAWTHHTGDALAASHAMVTHDLAVRAAATRYRFLELLTAGDLDSEELVLLGRSLGFDPTGRFRAFVYTAEAPVPEDVNVLHRALRGLPGVHQVVARGTVITVLSQALEALTDPWRLDAAIREALHGEAIGGIGRERQGLLGARASLGDAHRAAAITARGRTTAFDDEWIVAVLHDDAERLVDVLRTARQVADEHPTLAETVRCYAECGFSPVRTARQLFVHTNTVAYRLRRWHQLTGWDPRSFDGMSRSMACLRLAEAG